MNSPVIAGLSPVAPEHGCGCTVFTASAEHGTAGLSPCCGAPLDQPVQLREGGTAGRDPATRLDGIIAISPTTSIAQDVIAFFPQAWLLEPGSELLHSAYHDIPWSEAALVRELMKLPWPERSFPARLLSHLRQSTGTTSVSTLPVHYGSGPNLDLSARL